MAMAKDKILPNTARSFTNGIVLDFHKLWKTLWKLWKTSGFSNPLPIVESGGECLDSVLF